MSDETNTTPGPWVWRGKDGGLYQEGTAHRFGEPVLVPSYEYDSGIDTIVSEANMALIAAAPDMLLILKDVAALYQMTTDENPLAREIRRVIAKAEGRSQ